MKSNTHISNVLEGNNNKDRYDAEVKKILCDKTVLSWILKYTVEEFDRYSIEDIRECIEREPEELYGHGGLGSRYDLLESVFVCLGKEEEAGRGNKLHGMLSTLFSERLRSEEKEKILETDYDFITSIEVEGGLLQMCNLSDLVEERGIKKGLEQGRQEKLEAFLGLVRDGLLELSEAAKRLGMSEEELGELL